MTEYEIYKLPEGGYLVQTLVRDRYGYSSPGIFAATTVDEALKFIKKQFDKQEKAQ